MNGSELSHAIHSNRASGVEVMNTCLHDIDRANPAVTRSARSPIADDFGNKPTIAMPSLRNGNRWA